MGRRTEMNKQAFEINNQNLAHIDYCEAHLPGCTGFCKRTIAHRHKRNHYQSVEELTDPREVAIIGAWCHAKIEKDAELTREVFVRIRP